MDWPLDMRLEQGWDASESLAKILRDARGRDGETGHTRSGPHRADLQFLGFGREASAALSRGQSKTLVVLLALALGQVIREFGGETPVILLDDPLPELDIEGQDRLLGMISGQGCQALVSLPDSGVNPRRDTEVILFHVKRGEIRKMLE